LSRERLLSLGEKSRVRLLSVDAREDSEWQTQLAAASARAIFVGFRRSLAGTSPWREHEDLAGTVGLDVVRRHD
jgi:hypothetical protein